MSEFPAFEASLARAAHRRYGWRRWRPRIAFTLAAAAAAGVMLLLVARPAPRDDEVAWSKVNVARYGVDVSVPAGWQVATASLTPRLGDPREILTATTFSPVVPAHPCAQWPAVTLGPGDALVTVQERAGRIAFAPRPQRFEPVPTSPITARLVQACVGTGTVDYQDFSDGLRNFHALVVVAPRASARVRAQAYEILDRLRFDHGFVPWWRPAG
jgi:hypothetical protein